MDYNYNYQGQQRNDGGQNEQLYSNDAAQYSSDGYGWNAAQPMQPAVEATMAPRMPVYGQQPVSSYQQQSPYMNQNYQRADAFYPQTNNFTQPPAGMVGHPQYVQAMPPAFATPPNFNQTPFYAHPHQQQTATFPHPTQSSGTWPSYTEPLQLPQHRQPSAPASANPPAPSPRATPNRPQAVVEITRRSPSQPHLQAHRQSPHLPPHPPNAPLQHMHMPPQQPQRPSGPKNNPQASSAKAMKTLSAPTAPPVDYQQLLLLLAEDYINAAHGMGSLVAFYRRKEDTDHYYKLMATGLSCLETSLTRFRLAPAVEAQLALQYCNLVFKETENYDEVDKWLSKTIPLCDRHRLLDRKYAMHHLSARALFVTTPRLALKSLDSLIPNTQTYKHTPWVYALRFLRVSFAFKLGSSAQDTAPAIQNLKAISQLAASDDDGAVSALSATYEAMLHLRSASSSSIEDAKRAVAAAKSLQFHPLAQNLDQVWALLDCIEIICYLMEGNVGMATQKAEQLAPRMDDIRANPKPNDDGTLLVPLQAKPGPLTANTSGIFLRIDEKDHLVFQWLPHRDLWAFCFLLNAITAQTRTFADPKVESYIREGLKILRENFSEASVNRPDIFPTSCSVSTSCQRLDRWYSLKWFFHIYMTMNACSRAQWSTASDSLDEAQACPSMTSYGGSALRKRWETFLRATMLQGTGKTEEALSLYNSDVLQLPPTASPRVQDPEVDLCVLAALNTVLITIDPNHLEHGVATTLHEAVLPHVANHPNKSLRAAHDLLRSVLNPQDKLIDKKKHFQNCLSAARTVNNTQLVSIALSLMCTMFFKNVVGEQAQKSVSSARALADRSRSALWKSVSTGLQEEIALRHGNEAEASNAAMENQRLIDTLPDAVKGQFAFEQQQQG